MQCGVWVRIPVVDAPAPAAPPPAAPVAKPPPPAAPAPVHVPSGAARFRSIRWLALLLVVLLIAGALGTHAYLQIPPSPRKLEARLINWDASGDGSAYRIFGFHETGGGTRFERYVDLDNDEFLLAHQFRVYHQKGDDYYITFTEDYRGPPREPTVGRHQDEDTPFEPMPARVFNRTGRYYTGILGSHPFTLELDEEERFEALFYQNHRGDRIRLMYDYSNVRFPSFIRTREAGASGTPAQDELVYASLPRNAANFPAPREGQAQGRVAIDWHQDARPATDFLVRFTDAGGELMAETPMASVALPGGFSFAWEDRNRNGLVDEGDAYSYAHPEGLRMSFYDIWARQPVGSPRREGPWDPQWDLVTPSWRLYNLRQSS